jgi:hypothetical protein
LRRRFGADRILYVPVRANLKDDLGKEPTHRTRSFLFAAIGAVTAQLLDRQRVCFFENGVVSLNLPPVGQVVGARATRTTHPQAMAGFRRVLSAIFGQSFDVTNSYAWMTKTDVIGRIVQNGCGNLIRHTRSCTRVHADQLNPAGNVLSVSIAVLRFSPLGKKTKTLRMPTTFTFCSVNVRLGQIEKWRLPSSGRPRKSVK